MKFRTLLLCSFLTLVLLVAPRARAQSNGFKVLHQFATGTDANVPNSELIEGRDGNFYGTTAVGGVGGRGTIFRLTPAGEVTIMHAFAGADGDYPTGGLIQGQDGNFYGLTSFGGAGNAGIAYSMTPDGVLTTLYSFVPGGMGTAPDGSLYYAHGPGAYPDGSLIQGRDGNFYGTTSIGGTNDTGIFYSLTPTGTLTTLTNLARIAQTNGQFYTNALIQSDDGNFYGTSSAGGTGGWGIVYKLTPTGEMTTLYNFGSDHVGDGLTPNAGLIQGRDGNLYGMTGAGGINNQGTIFSMTPAGVLTTLHRFNSVTHEGASPQGRLLQDGDGNLYGTTVMGGAVGYENGYSGSGTVFMLTTAGELHTLHHFTGGAGGMYPAVGLTRGRDGNFYGLLGDYDPQDGGKIFVLPPPTELPPPLAVFLTVPVAEVVTEGTTLAADEFLVSLSRVITTDVVVHYTLKGSAVNGADYASLKGKAKLKAGKLTKPILVQPLKKWYYPNKKTVVLTLQPGDGFSLEGEPSAKVKFIGHGHW